MLESLERALAGKEQVGTGPLTIEHILPQAITPWWEEHLGETWREVHDLKLHTLGNLTLTGYNSELSNGGFSAKRALFLQSPIQLNKGITRFEKWDEEAIQQRGEELAELALRVWPYFGPADSLFTTTTNPGFRGKTPVSVIAIGAKREVTTWREVLQTTLETVRETSPDTFDGIVEQFPRLVGIDAGKFRSPRSLGTHLHFETNLSAEAIARYCQQVVVAAGYSSGDWMVETK